MPDTLTRTAHRASATSATQLDAYTHALIDRAHGFKDDADPYLPGLIATRVYRDRPDLPTVLKRPELLAETLEQLKPVILPQDTILSPVYRRFQVHTGVSKADSWRIRVLHPEWRGYDDQWPLPPEVQKGCSDTACSALRRDGARRESWRIHSLWSV